MYTRDCAKTTWECIYSPLLHLRGGDVDAICLATTAHGEVYIKSRQVVPEVALRDNVERSGVVKDVVVQREVTAM